MNASDHDRDARYNGMISLLSFVFGLNAFIFGYLLYLNQTTWCISTFAAGLFLLVNSIQRAVWMMDSKRLADRERYWEDVYNNPKFPRL